MALYDLVDWKYPDRENPIKYAGSGCGHGCGGSSCRPSCHPSCGGSACSSGSGRKSGGGSDGCYIATSVYGSYDCPEVWTLRRFRDEYLKGSVFGRLFVRLYYAVSPGLVRRVGGSDFFRIPVKKVLDQFVNHLKNKGYQDTPYDDR